MDVHYCNADNRNSAQICLQNRDFENNASLREAFPWLDLDEDDHFMRCAKAFGADAIAIKEWADAIGDAAYHFDENVPSIAIARSQLSAARTACPNAAFEESVYVLEDKSGGSVRIREIAVREIE